MNNMTYSINVNFCKGDKRITYTKDYVITEIVEGINGYKNPVWEIVSIEHINTSNKDISILVNNE